jgi:threonine aldolase
MLGGGMRQAGILAAGGLYALEHNIAPAEDHDNAAYFAAELAKMKASRSARRRPTSSTSTFRRSSARPQRRAGADAHPRLDVAAPAHRHPHGRQRDDIDRAITVFGDFFG